MFYGEYQRHLDDKGRVMIPTELRAEMAGQVFITIGLDYNLMLWQSYYFDQILESLDQTSFIDPQARMLRRVFNGKSRPIQLDGNARLRIPSELAAMVGIQNGSDIMLVGCRQYLEIWNREEWEKINTALVDPTLNQERYQQFNIILKNPPPADRNPSSLSN